MEQQKRRPDVGLSLLVMKGDMVLLGKRRGSHGAGEYAGLGGHLERGESMVESLMREVVEEAGPDFRISNLAMICVTNLVNYYPVTGKHYADLGFVAEWESGEPVVMEPHKVESWDWYPLDELPSPLFGATENILQAHQTGDFFFDAHPQSN